MKAILLLPSIHQVMKAEKILKGRGIRVDLIPVPREISSDCGVAVEVPADSCEEALRTLEGHRMRIIESYERGPDGRFSKSEKGPLSSGEDTSPEGR